MTPVQPMKCLRIHLGFVAVTKSGRLFVIGGQQSACLTVGIGLVCGRDALHEHTRQVRHRDHVVPPIGVKKPPDPASADPWSGPSLMRRDLTDDVTGIRAHSLHHSLAVFVPQMQYDSIDQSPA